MVGDKVHNDPRDPAYQRRMRGALGEVWCARHHRRDLARRAAAGRGDAAGGRRGHRLSWRHPELDSSLELSTKGP